MGVVLHEVCDPEEIFIRAKRIDFAAPNLGYLMLDALHEDGIAITAGGEEVAEKFDELHDASFELAAQPLEIRDSARPSGGRGWASASAVATPRLMFDLNDNYLRGRNTPKPDDDSHPSVLRIYSASEGVRPIFERGGDAFDEALRDEYNLPLFPRFKDIQDNMTRLPEPEELERFNERRSLAGLPEMTLDDVINVLYTVVNHDDGTTISAGTQPRIKGGSEGVAPALELAVEGKPGLYVPVRGLQPGEILWYTGRVGASLSNNELSPTYHRVKNNHRDRSSILYFDSVDHKRVLEQDTPRILNLAGWRRVLAAAMLGQNIEEEFQYVPS